MSEEKKQNLKEYQKKNIKKQKSLKIKQFYNNLSVYSVIFFTIRLKKHSFINKINKSLSAIFYLYCNYPLQNLV